MIRLGVCGASGRMGQRILALASQDTEHFTITAAFERAGNPNVGTALNMLNNEIDSPLLISGDMGSHLSVCDTVIDFTSPEASLTHAEHCYEKGKAIVIGTTGFTPDQLDQIVAYSERIPIVLAPNMSVGVNLLFSLVNKVAALLSDDYDCEIVELHHRLKKDSPSGTAQRLAEIIAAARQVSLEEKGCFGRKGMVGARPRGEIGVHAVRLGSVVGDHTVTFANEAERIELTHKAQSRDVFAYGSLRAALFLAGKEPGLFDMQDVLNLR